jgi:hypothetical protein
MNGIDEVLIKSKCIDHHILYKRLYIKQKYLNIYSVNIAQISHIRTMTMFNKVNSFLRSYENTLTNDKMFAKVLFDEMPKIILKHNLHKENVQEGSKIEIKNVKVLKDLQKLVPNYSFDVVYLRKYIPKGKYKTDDIFKSRFEKTNYIYFDIYFQCEDVNVYKNRIRKTLKTIDKVSNRKKNILICLQEIKPLLEFVVVLNEFPQFHLQYPKIINVENEKENFDKKYKTLFFKSNTILLSKNFQYSILHSITNDVLLDFFNHKRVINGEVMIDRNKNQNIKYYIPSFNLYIYNIHSFIYKDKRIIDFFQKKGLDFLRNVDKNFFIIGDLNFQMSQNIIEEFKKLLENNHMTSEFVETPFYKKKKTFDGYIVKLLY